MTWFDWWYAFWDAWFDMPQIDGPCVTGAGYCIRCPWYYYCCKRGWPDGAEDPSREDR